MKKIAFLIRDLNFGGAQKQLITLALGLDRKGYKIFILHFYGGPLEGDLDESGVKLISLKKGGRWDLFFLFRLVRVLRHLNPDVFHGYLDLPNILVYLTRKFLMKTITIWGIRGSKKNLNEYDWMARLMATLESFLCHFPDVILVNSKAGFKHAVKRGFPENKMVVIPNGINLEVFRPDREAGKKIRAEWGIRENQILIGLVGRLHPEKDHRTFLKAASLFVKDIKNTRFVCVGNGPESYKSGLMNFAKQIGVSDYLLWIDPRPDMSSVYNALTINTSSSITEGFSNVIAEAMACGVPCVVTDVGDSAWIVGETGIVVPKVDPNALAAGWKRCLIQNNKSITYKARLRIQNNFSVNKLVENTEKYFLPNYLKIL